MKLTIDIPETAIQEALEIWANLTDASWCIQHNVNATEPWVKVRTERMRGASDKERSFKLDLERGLRLMYENDRWRTPITRWRQFECDCFVQYAAFGEIRF